MIEGVGQNIVPSTALYVTFGFAGSNTEGGFKSGLGDCFRRRDIKNAD
jgi:hypothetical protein